MSKCITFVSITFRFVNEDLSFVICHTGRTKLEPVAVVVLSVIMSVASIQLVRESVQILIGLFSDPNNLPNFEITTIVIAASTVGMLIPEFQFVTKNIIVLEYYYIVVLSYFKCTRTQISTFCI